jgi:hypothetical protein
MLKKFLPLVVATFALIACQNQEPITLKISNPGTILSTNGTLTVQVDVTGGKPESVTLLKNGAPFATVPAPYQYAWNTTTEPEGTYFLTAKVNRGGQGFSAAEEFTTPPRTVVVDRTAPTVVSRTPAPDQADVDVKGSISVTFSEPVDPKTVDDSAVDLMIDNLSVKKSLTLSSDLKTLEIKSIDEPNPAKPISYSILITEKIKDYAGNVITLPKDSWIWRISGWETIGNTNINLNTSNGFGVYSAALDVNQNPVVAWIDTNVESTYSVFVKRWTGSAWTLVGSGGVGTFPAGSAETVSVAVDSKNNIFLAWSSQGKLFVKQWIGSVWNLVGPKEINEIPNEFTDVSGLNLSLDQNGLPVVAWNTNRDIFVKRWTGSEWLLVGPGSISRDVGNSTTKPMVALNGNGNLFIAWINFSDNKVFVKKWSGSSWESLGLVAVNQGIGDAQDPFLAIDKDGNPVVVWCGIGDKVAGKIFVNRWTGSAWVLVGSEALKQNSTLFAYQPSVFVDSKNNPVVVMFGDGHGQNDQNSDNSIDVFAYKWTGSTWKFADKILNYAINGFNPILMLTKSDIPIVAYRESEAFPPIFESKIFRLVVKRFSR